MEIPQLLKNIKSFTNLWDRLTDLSSKIQYYILLLAVFAFSGCEDPLLSESDLLGSTGVLNVSVLDSFSIRTYTLTDEVLGGKNLSVSLLANMDDPIFGKTYAAFATEVNLAVNNLNLGTNLVVDSVVLALDYFGTYGKNDLPTDIYVYTLNEALNVSATYNTDYHFKVNTPPVGQKLDFIHNFRDSVFTTAGNFPAQLRVRLNNAVGQRIIDQSGTANLADDAAFRAFFPGFYVATGQSKKGNGSVYIDVLSSYSNLSVFYHSDSTSGLNVVFPITESATQVNTYVHDLNGSESTYFIDRQSAEGDSIIMLKSMGGTRAKIEIDGIENLDSIAVNRAELILTQIIEPTNMHQLYEPPTELILFRIDEDGNSILLADLTSELSGHFGGRVELIEGSAGNVQYVFNISRYAQQLINGDFNNNGLYLNIVSGNVLADRIILGGGNNSAYGVKFKVYYTKI